MVNLKHSGNIGDIIYSLPAVKYIYDNIDKEIIFYLNPVDNRMSLKLAEILAPLLQHQYYIMDVKIWNGEHIDYDLDLFRKVELKEGHLGKMHLMAFNFPIEEINEQSIFIEDKIESSYDILINRTARYRNANFPWSNLIQDYQIQGMKVGFIGLEEEYNEFKQTTGIELNWIPTKDMLEVAKLINASQLFIGNCSSPYAIAEGLKHQTIQESCPWCLTCLYPRDNAWYFINDFAKILK